MITQHELTLCEAAMCLWEEVLNLVAKNDARVIAFVEHEGYASARLKVISWVEQLEEDYQKAVAEGYDDSFDWEFVPRWVDKKL